MVLPVIAEDVSNVYDTIRDIDNLLPMSHDEIPITNDSLCIVVEITLHQKKKNFPENCRFGKLS